MPFISNITTIRVMGRIYQVTLAGTLHYGAFEVLDEHKGSVCRGNYRVTAAERALVNTVWDQRLVPQTSILGEVLELAPRLPERQSD